MNPSRVLLMQLAERISAKGNRYMSGWLGKASVVAFQAEEPDKFGNPVWDLFVSEPQPRAEQQQSKPEAGQERGPARRPGARNEASVSQPPAEGNGSRRAFHSDAPAKPSTRPQERGDGWRGSRYVRPANGARRAPVADDGAFYEDSLEDIGR